MALTVFEVERRLAVLDELPLFLPDGACPASILLLLLLALLLEFLYRKMLLNVFDSATYNIVT